MVGRSGRVGGREEAASGSTIGESSAYATKVEGEGEGGGGEGGDGGEGAGAGTKQLHR